jgi:hypothetical protein
MKKAVLFSLVILCCINSFSQWDLSRKKGFIHGKLVGTTDTLVGYFWFDDKISQNGQVVQYRENLSTGKRKSFPSRRYEYFESDSVYLEKFGDIPTITGDLLFMIPAVGSVQ